ncbi:hypothetical protein D3C78_1636760 [compost metagenome]
MAEAEHVAFAVVQLTRLLGFLLAAIERAVGIDLWQQLAVGLTLAPLAALVARLGGEDAWVFEHGFLEQLPEVHHGLLIL